MYVHEPKTFTLYLLESCVCMTLYIIMQIRYTIIKYSDQVIIPHLRVVYARNVVVDMLVS